MDYYQKYLKYKIKYLNYINTLYNQKGGALDTTYLKNINPFDETSTIEKYLNIFYKYYTNETDFVKNITFIFTDNQNSIYSYFYDNRNGELNNIKVNSVKGKINYLIGFTYIQYIVFKYYKEHESIMNNQIDVKRTFYKFIINPDIDNDKLQKYNHAKLDINIGGFFSNISKEFDLTKIRGNKKSKINSFIEENYKDDNKIKNMFYLLLNIVWINLSDADGITIYYQDIYNIFLKINQHIDNFNQYIQVLNNKSGSNISTIDNSEINSFLQNFAQFKQNRENNEFDQELLKNDIQDNDDIYLKIAKIQVAKGFTITLETQNYVTYEYDIDGSKEIQEYADCGEISLRNFIKILISDENNNFNVNILKGMADPVLKDGESTLLIDYFKKYKNNSELIGDGESRNKWEKF